MGRMKLLLRPLKWAVVLAISPAVIFLALFLGLSYGFGWLVLWSLTEAD
jgi:hypothetical protein